MSESQGESGSDSGDGSLQRFKFVVVGGGIAGVTCAETLAVLSPNEKHLLISASALVKTVTNFKQVSKVLEDFEVKEKHFKTLETQCANVVTLHAAVTKLDAARKVLRTSAGHAVTYDFLCICSGGKPKVIADGNPLVLGIRDTETVQVFQEKIHNAKRIVIVGNGGIATELAYEVEGCEVVWAIKDESISRTFVDAGAAQFFLPQLTADKQTQQGPSKRLKYTTQEIDDASASNTENVQGNALGPDWSNKISLTGMLNRSHNVHVEYKVEVARILSPEEIRNENLKEESFPGSQEVRDSWPIYVELTNRKVYGCDFVVSATGVVPNTSPFQGNGLLLASDGGICVNDKMQTNVSRVYAAGDVCTASWQPAKHWTQMRLWSQARQMGAYAAKCMLAESQHEPVEMDFCFELFAHVTKFFNYKVVLLGKFNVQGLGTNYELLLRVTKGVEYIKLVLSEGCVQGAVLIGETDLEETIENLILNQLDVTPYKDHLLDPNIDIEDFFD